ncbi:MAG: flagellar hook-basal body complex protein FliE [Nitrospinae bacterium]|nr:flagellar hook-basal body complex protein FliE [Nitrospinota bacterium]
MKITGLNTNFKPLGADLGLKSAHTGGTTGKSFGDALKESMDEVNNLQIDADKSIEALVSGENKDIHGTMIALSKADIAFRMTVQVRNKVIDAYQEVMRMQV